MRSVANYILLGMILLKTPLLAQQDLRTRFHNDMFRKEGLEAIMTQYTVNGSSNDLQLAYVGISETMYAEHVFLPTAKLSYFSKGKQKIEKAIQQSPQNIELRYIRLLVQLNAPTMLNYNDNISEDLQQFIAEIPASTIPTSWQSRFVRHLLAAKHLSTAQNSALQQLQLQLRTKAFH